MVKRYNLLCLTYRVVVPAKGSSFAECEDYAWENCRGDFSSGLWATTPAERLRAHNSTYFHFEFEFVDENDAMLFKLRWVGNADE